MVLWKWDNAGSKGLKATDHVEGSARIVRLRVIISPYRLLVKGPVYPT